MSYEQSESRFDPPRDDGGRRWWTPDDPPRAEREDAAGQPEDVASDGDRGEGGGKAGGGSTWSAETVRLYTVIIHVCVPVGILFSAGFGSFVAALVMWLAKKDEEPVIDEHGREVVNTMLWLFIANVILGVLSLSPLVCVTVPLLLIGNLVIAVYGIVGAIDAQSGVLRRYPGVARFL